MAPKPARKLTHSVSVRPMTLPATAPTMISISATEMATRIEMIDAASARPSHSADASQTFVTVHSSILSEVTAPTRSGTEGRQEAWPIKANSSHRTSRGRSHQPQRRLSGSSIPIEKKHGSLSTTDKSGKGEYFQDCLAADPSSGYSPCVGPIFVHLRTKGPCKVQPMLDFVREPSQPSCNVTRTEARVPS